MRILWIVQEEIRTTREMIGNAVSGYWKEALLDMLEKHSDLNINAAFPGKGFKINGNDKYTFRFPKKKVYRRLPLKTIEDLLAIIEDAKPDLIHIHGTEKPYALIRNYTEVPVVVSLQGFLSESYNSVLGEIAIPVWNKEKTLKERILRNGFLHMHANWFRNSCVEKELVVKNKYFIGRTLFDYRFVMKNNPSAVYFQGYELLRNRFYEVDWDLSRVKRHSVYISSFNNPLKGFHVLLNAIPYLINEFPDIQIIVPGSLSTRNTSKVFGNSYYRYIDRLIRKHRLLGKVFFRGKLDSFQISEVLKEAHIFVLPSFVENSSNALGEAQIIGVPCIVSNCGGIPSIVTDNKNGLFFNKGDAYELSIRIRQIFLNDTLAQSLSAESKKEGRKFHNRETISHQYHDIYQTIISNESSS